MKRKITGVDHAHGHDYQVDEYKLANKNEEKPVWVLQRQPNPAKGETYIQIWLKDDAFEISSNKLSELLANVIQNQVKEKR